MEHIVKRRGHKETFDERKIYASCYAAYMGTHGRYADRIYAEKICAYICKDVKKWMRSKKTVTSDAIFKETIKALKKYDKQTAFMYETHRDIA